MSSTQLTIDTREIEFVLNEWLKVGDLCRYKRYQDFSGKDFDLLVKEGLRFSMEVLAPTMAESDREGCRMENGRAKVPECLKEPYKKACELGWSSLKAAPRYGGYGVPWVVDTAVQEGLIGANMGLSMYFGLTGGAARLIEDFGTEASKNKYCAAMHTGRFTGTMCLSEPNAGSDVGASTATAKRNEDGSYFIKGTKCWISSGDNDLGENVIHTVLARVEGAPDGTAGLSLFVVPSFLVHEDGSVGESNDVTTVSIEHKMGISCSATAVLSFGDNGRCKGWLLGEEGGGMYCMFHMMNEERILVGGVGLSIAAAAYHNARDYAKERIQGSHIRDLVKSGKRENDSSAEAQKNAPIQRVAIIEHPDVRRMLLNMKARVECMRALLYGTVLFNDLRLASEDEEEKKRAEDMSQILTPMAKAWCTEIGVDVVRDGIQVLGGVGYTRDFPLEQYYRDVRVTTIYEGTTGIQALDLVGRKLTMRNGALFMRLMGMFGELMETHTDHPVIGPLVKSWTEHCEMLSQLAMGVADVLKERGAEGMALFATPFLMFVSAVTSGYFFLQQGLVASEALNALKQANSVEESQLADFLNENSDAAFYQNKLITLRYYIEVLLPYYAGHMKAAQIRNFDPLEVKF